MTRDSKGVRVRVRVSVPASVPNDRTAATPMPSCSAASISAHRRWTIRTFALTYAGVTQRLWLAVLVPTQTALTGMDAQVAFDHAYHIVLFLSWLPNLIKANDLFGKFRTLLDQTPNLNVDQEIDKLQSQLSDLYATAPTPTK